MILSKDKFVEIINTLKKYDEIEDELNAVIRKTWNAGYRNLDLDYIRIQPDMDMTIEVLEYMFNDQLGQTISWWVYQMEFGKRCTDEGDITVGNKSYVTRTPEELYDFLIEFME